ncbi:hypothetical protein ACQEVF_30570 [Nonomuraea polychroma]|uniref:hypothetical protein n=1 Tax=Nonomuraea polychroma TaxID=46176 RepID=UPI003D94C47B
MHRLRRHDQVLRVRYAICTVRTSTLNRLYNDALDGRIPFRPYVKYYVSYRYYR